MATFNTAAIKKIQELAKKSQYMKKQWVTSEDSKMSLSEYVELIDPTYKHISDNPVIIAKERKNGNLFLKMWIPLGEEPYGAEYDLSYENEFNEGDEIDKDSLCFYIERFFEKEHLYITGNVIE